MSERPKGRQLHPKRQEPAVFTFDCEDAEQSEERRLTMAFDDCDVVDRQTIISIVRRLNVLAEEQGEDLAVAIGERIEQLLVGRAPDA